MEPNEQNEFIFDHPPSREEMLMAIEAEDDPRSWTYQRNYPRPKISWVSMVIHVLFLSAAMVLYMLLRHTQPAWLKALPVMILLLYTVFRLKAFALFMVKLYQKFAPISLRSRCRFDPSCSEYMRLAIEKYGLWQGLKKGLNRWKRCNIHDGGVDYP